MKGIVSFLTLVMICFIAFALSVSAQTPKAEKIQEFGNDHCDLYLARMDYAIAQVYSNPNARGYVLVYEGKFQQYKYKKMIVTKLFLFCRSEGWQKQESNQ